MSPCSSTLLSQGHCNSSPGSENITIVGRAPFSRVMDKSGFYFLSYYFKKIAKPGTEGSSRVGILAKNQEIGGRRAREQNMWKKFIK